MITSWLPFDIDLQTKKLISKNVPFFYSKLFRCFELNIWYFKEVLEIDNVIIVFLYFPDVFLLYIVYSIALHLFYAVQDLIKIKRPKFHETFNSYCISLCILSTNSILIYELILFENFSVG